MIKQCKIYDKENQIHHLGIILDNGDVICGCCGGVIPSDEIGPDEDHEIVEIYSDWCSLDGELD